ncbi:F-box family protein [Theobroma cacao]|uniref:F-box family protein n=1 Tax=Theobroma cacao TaxID=3641 RepID=A0A061FLU1_THECC|nr:F-box family protein [Theobroma cacao]
MIISESMKTNFVCNVEPFSDNYLSPGRGNPMKAEEKMGRPMKAEGKRGKKNPETEHDPDDSQRNTAKRQNMIQMTAKETMQRNDDSALLAAIAPNDVLHLDFSAGEQGLSRSFNWLLPLNLPARDKWPFPYKHDKLLELNLPLQQFKIKALYLESACCLSSKALTSMVSYLPFLESLTIAKCNGVQSLDIENAARLQKLTVLDCPQLEYFCFGGSSCLKSFQYRGRLVSFRFKPSCKFNSYHSLNEHFYRCGFHLEAAMLDFRQGPLTRWTWDFEMPTSAGPNGFYKICNCGSTTLFQCFKLILNSVGRAESLTMCRWLFEACFSNLSKLSKENFSFMLLYSYPLITD